MSENPKKLTTFPTRFDAIKYLVILCGLYNSPASRQYFIYNILFDFLHCFVQVYHDNIFIYSKTSQNHYFHIC